METLLSGLSNLFPWLMDYTIDISMLICLVFIIKLIVSKRLPVWWHYSLWLILLVRMIIPWEFENHLSMQNGMPFSMNKDLFGSILLDKEALISGIATGASSNWQGWNVPADKALLFIWFIGAMAFGVYILVKNVSFWLIIKERPLLNDKKLLDLLEECKSRMKIHTVLGVIMTNKVKSPALFGYIRPRLLLPEGILEKLDDEELTYVFMHELGHLKRHDIGISWLLSIMQIIHWFNPLVWLAFYQMRVDQESACDALVLSRIKQNQSADYAGTIIGFLEKFCQNRQLPALAGIMENKSQIKRRIAMIVNYKRYSKKMTAAAIAMLIMTGFIFFTLTGFAKEKQRQIPTIPSHEAQVALVAAQGFYNQEKFAEARQPLLDFMDTQTEDIPEVLYLMLGQCWYLEENCEEAMKAWKAGHEAFPESDELFRNYAVVTYFAEDYKEAGKLFEQYYDFMKEKDVQFLNNAAGAFYKGENLEEAKRVFKRMIDLPGEPKKEWLSNVMGICIELGNKDEAKEYKSLLEEY